MSGPALYGHLIPLIRRHIAPVLHGILDPKDREKQPISDETIRRAAMLLSGGVPSDVTAVSVEGLRERQARQAEQQWEEAKERSRQREEQVTRAEEAIGAALTRPVPSDVTRAEVAPLPERPEMRAQAPRDLLAERTQQGLERIHAAEIEQLRKAVDQMAGMLPVPKPIIEGVLGVARGGMASLAVTENIAAVMPEGRLKEFWERRTQRRELAHEAAGIAGRLGEMAGFIAPYIVGIEAAMPMMEKMMLTGALRQAGPGLYLMRHPRIATAAMFAATEVPFSLARHTPQLVEGGLKDVGEILLETGVESMIAGALGLVLPPMFGKPPISPSVLGLEAAAEQAETLSRLPLRMYRGRLEHWTNQQGLTRLDPNYMGYGEATRTDMVKATGGPRLIYTYREGTPPEPQLVDKAYKYTTQEITAPIYDIGTDPDGIVQAFQQSYRLRGATPYRLGADPEPGKIYQYLMDLGYDGFMVTNHPDPHLANAVVMFRGVSVGEGVETAVARELERVRVTGLLGGRGIEEQVNQLTRSAEAVRQVEEINYLQNLAATRRATETAGALSGIRDLATLTFETGSKIFDNVRTLIRNEGFVGTIRRLAQHVNNEAGFTDMGRRRPNGFFEYPERITRPDIAKYRNPAAVQGAWLVHGEGITLGSPEWTSRMIELYGSNVLQDMPVLVRTSEMYSERLLNWAVNNELPTLKRLLELYHAGEDMSRWYNASFSELKTIFGDDAELMARLLSATSANTSIDANVSLALKAYNLYKNYGRIPTASDGFMVEQARQVGRAIRGDELTGPKVGQFIRALLGDENAIVVDKWMMRAFNFNRMYWSAKHQKYLEHATPETSERQFIEAAINRMADQLNIAPREAQAGLWAGVKRGAGDEGALVPYEIVIRNLLRMRSFVSEEDFASSLRNHDWVVLTAHRSGMTAGQSEAAMAELQRTLRQMGYRPVEADGAWLPKPGAAVEYEPSFLVPALTETEGVVLARRFGQNSIATQRGLITTTEDGFGNLTPWSDRNHIVWEGIPTRDSPFHPNNLGEPSGVFGYTKVTFGGRVVYFAGRPDFEVTVPAFPYIRPSPAATARGTLETVRLDKPLSEHSDTELLSLLQRTTQNAERFSQAQAAAEAEGEVFLGNIEAAAYDVQQVRLEIWKRNGLLIRQAEDQIGGANILRGEGGFTSIGERTDLAGTQVVGPNGQPKAMYHGSNTAFETFDPGKMDDAALYGPGYYFTDSPEIASQYSFIDTSVNQWLQREREAVQRLAEVEQLARINPAAARTLKQETERELRGIRNWLRSGSEQLSGRNPNVRPVLLNVQKPFDMEAPVTGDIIERFIRIAEESDQRVLANRLKERKVDLQTGSMMGYQLYSSIVEDLYAEFRSLGGEWGRVPHRWRDWARNTHGELPIAKKVANSMLQRAGFDGIRYQGGQIMGEGVSHDVWVAFSRDQIRSVWGFGQAGRTSLGAMENLATFGLGAATGAAIGGRTAEDRRLGMVLGAIGGGVGAVALTNIGLRMWSRRGRATLEARPEYRPPAPPKLPPPTAAQPVYPPEELVNLAKFDIDPAVLDPTAMNTLREEVTRAATQRSMTFKEPVTRAETMQRAQDIAQRFGLDPTAIRPSAGRLSGEEMVAIENIVSRNTQKIVELGNIMKNPNIDAADMQILQMNMAGLREQNNHVLGMLFEARTQAGRDLNALKYLANRNFEDVEWWVVQARNMLGNSAEPATLYTDIAEFIRQGDRSGLVNYIQRLRSASWDEKWVTLWKAGLLSAPPTHMANIVGNTTMAVLEQVKDAPAILYDRMLAAAMRNGVRTKPGFTQLAPVAVASMRGVKQGLEETLHIMGLRNFARELRAGNISGAFGELRGQPLTQALERYDIRRLANFDNVFLDVYTKVIFNALTAGDRIFRNIALYRSLESQMRALAEEGAINAGLKRGTKAYRDFLEKTLAEYRQRPPAGVMLNAIADSELAIFVNNGVLARAASGLKRPFGSAGDVVIPFARTPSNIAGRVLEYSPFGMASVVWNTFKLITNQAMPAAEARALQRATADRFGRSVTGTVLVALGYKLAEMGLMTGSLPRDPSERAQWEHEGRAGNSILVDGMWRSVERLSPLGNLLALGANTYWIFQDPQLTASERLEQSVMSVGRTISEQSFLKGTSAFLETIQGERKVNTFGSQLAGSAVPSLLARVARVVDPIRRDPNTPWENAMSRFPYLSRLVPAKIDQFGREMEWNQGPIAAFFDLLYSRPDMTRNDEVLAEMRRVGANVSIPKQEDDETDDDYQARLIAWGKEWERHVRFVVQSSAYQRVDEHARRLAEMYHLPEEDIDNLGVEMQRYAIESEVQWVRAKLRELGHLGQAHTYESGGRIMERVTNRLVTLHLEERVRRQP